MTDPPLVSKHGLTRALLLAAAAAASSATFDRESATTFVYPDFDGSAWTAPARSLRPIRRERQPTAPVVEPVLSTVPENAAGFKCADSALVEAAGTKCSLLAKSIGPLGCQRVLADLAAERGKSLDGIPAAFRNRRVADACPYSCGLCETCAPGCARWFIGNGWCELACNVKACQWDGGDCWETDCIVSEWGDLSTCSVTCDPGSPSGNGGVQIRKREVKVKPSSAGQSCPPLEEKVYGCNANIPCPIECEVSDWSAWSPCSAACGVGQSTRARTVVRSPAHGAQRCPELKHSRPCFLTECPAPCETSSWSPWSECSATCGGGTQSRQRSVLSPPVGEFNICPSLFEERTCNAFDCTSTNESSCKFSPWSSWSDCSAKCGGGIMAQTRNVLSENCTASSTELERTKVCNAFECGKKVSRHCPDWQSLKVIDCETSPWSEWGSCEGSVCGEGRQRRTRNVTVLPSNLGRACGDLEETRKCHIKPCAVDCGVSDWSDLSDCILTFPKESDCGFGSRMRSRYVRTMPESGGAPCPELVDFEECHKPCDGDRWDECFESSTLKSNWTSCRESCQSHSSDGTLPVTPISTRHPVISLWGPKCNDEKLELRICDNEPDCSISESDCIVSAWSAWTDCSSRCNGGIRSRSRSIIRAESPLGSKCPALVEEEACGVDPCPIDCELGKWSEWSACSAGCGQGTQMRSRMILRNPNSHPLAKKCGPVTQVAPCFSSHGACDQDCLVGEWSSWSSCDKSCGAGVRRRQRPITQAPIRNGKACPLLEELSVCNEEACAVDCAMSHWSDWSDCSASCLSKSDGKQLRTRSVIREAAYGGKACPKVLEESRMCHGPDSCSKVACSMGPWQACSATCGEGETVRFPIPPNPDADASICKTSHQTAPCFLTACPVDCVVSDWSSWEPCPVLCGGGDHKRTREIVVPAANGGQACPILWELQRCNELECENSSSQSDCQLSEWTSWAPCTEDCGGGVTHRTRVIERAPGIGGKECGNLSETRGCNLQRCPDVLCDDNSRLAEQGITCSILKTQGCSTPLWDLARAHGVDLPSDVPPEARVQDACPKTCGVCEECAPGCQLRDLGNTVCTPECDVESCEFDRGDCGGDCLLPDDLYKRDFIIQPAVTALQDGQSVEVRCLPGFRFEHRSALEFVSLQCGALSSQPLMLHLLPTPSSSIGDAPEDITAIRCIEDECPFVGVYGLKTDLALFNGIYGRDFNSITPYSAFIRRAGKRLLSLAAVPSRKKHVKWRLSELDNNERTAERLMPDLLSSNYDEPVPVGADLKVLDGLNWSVAAEDEAMFPLDETIELTCLSLAEKAALKSTTKKFSSRIPTSPTSSMPVKCEDIKMVEQLSGYTCAQLERAVGCEFRLAETGHKLPPFLPENATVSFVCPETCDQCVECSSKCHVWFLGNGHCDSACNIEECNFDEGDCLEKDVILASDRLLAEGLTNNTTATCVDDPLVAMMGFSCQLLKMASALPDMGGCEASILSLAAAQGIAVSLPEGVPKDIRVVDACPLTCECCDCEGFGQFQHFPLVGDKRGGEEALTPNAPAASNVEAPPCSDSEIVHQYASMTCGEIYHLLKRCDLTLGELGYLPEGMPDTITLSGLCPWSCGICKNDKLPPYECHDFSALQEMSGFACSQAVSLLGTSICDKRLKSFGYEMPAAVPDDALFSSMCGATCGVCNSDSVANPTKAPLSNAACADADFVYSMTGFECDALVDIQGDCTVTLESLGYILPVNVPANATLAQACPVSCNSCPAEPSGVCEDSKIAFAQLGSSCADLIAADGCAALLSASSVIRVGLSAALADGVRVGDICRSSCGYCGSSALTNDSGICRDHPAVAQSGYSCNLFLQFAPDGCQTPLLRLLGRGASLPAGVPADTTVQDACPRTCNLCQDTDASVAPTCEDSPLLSAVQLSCSQVIQLAGGAGAGCDSTIASIAGNTPVAAMLPDGMRVKDVCSRSCLLCSTPSCDDGYTNGNETGIDCGGSCRPCRQCSSGPLKSLGVGLASVSTTGTQSFTHNSERYVVCTGGYKSPSSSVEKITCQDGTWSTPTTKCAEETIEVWRGTLGLTNGESFDFTVLPPLLSAWSTLVQLAYPNIDTTDFRIASAGSCTAMASTATGECADNALVEQTGFGCQMLAGLGCSQSLAALASIQGTKLPAGIPKDALVSDACPLTCNTCAEAMARMALYASTLTPSDDPLGPGCFKADLLLFTDLNIPQQLSTTFGSTSNVNRLVTAAFKDALLAANSTVFSNWTASLDVEAEANSISRVTQNALAFVTSRPVDVLVLEPISDAAVGFGEESSGAQDIPNLPLLIPLERRNVTLTVWESAYANKQAVGRARAVYKSKGIMPSIKFSETPAEIQSSLTPQTLAYPKDSRLQGYYYGKSPLGSVLTDDTRLVQECSANSLCCGLREDFQNFLDGPCGITLYASGIPSDSDMRAFCRVPEMEPGQLSCASQALIMLHPYRDKGEASCRAAELALRVIEGWCALNPVSNNLCILSMEADLNDLTYESITLKSKHDLDITCDLQSCMRSHFKYVSAVAELTVGWSGQDVYENNDPDDDESALLRLLPSLERHRRLAGKRVSIPSFRRGLSELAMQNMSIKPSSKTRLLSASESSPRFLIPLAQIGSPLLDLVCTQVNGDYCQQTLQLLAEDDPVSNPDLLQSPCSSPCLMPILQKIGMIILNQGQSLRSPSHVSFGTLLTHYSRFACMQGVAGSRCQLLQPRGPFLYPKVFNMTLPTFSTNRCTACSPTYLGDGQCDRECFTPECGFDAKDCLPWTTYPETLGRLISSLCLPSLNDVCNPLRKDYDCAAGGCRTKLHTCLETFGCCYAGTFETLRTTFQNQRSLMIEAYQFGSEEFTEMTTYFNEFDLDRSVTFLEQNCSLSLDRTCDHGGPSREIRYLVEFSNLKENISGRRLQGVTQIPTLTEFFNESETIRGLANHLNLIPSDIYRIVLRRFESADVIQIEIDLRLGDLNWDAGGELATVEKALTTVLRQSPAFWHAVKDSAQPVESSSTYFEVPFVAPAASFVKAPEQVYAGTRGMSTRSENLLKSPCSAAEAWKTSQKGMVVGSSTEMSSELVPHGTQLSVSCLSGYVGNAKNGILKCDEGAWVSPTNFKCEKPCINDPFEALGLSAFTTMALPKSNMKLTQLLSPQVIKSQTILTPGSKYPSGATLILGCLDGFTANISREWGLVATECTNGKWSKVPLDCQPRCSSIPSFVAQSPEAYVMSNVEETRYGGVRSLKCSAGYFAIPPSFEGLSTSVSCLREGKWSHPSFRCVAGLAVDPSKGKSTVEKMMSTLFSRTGIVSLCIFFGCMVIVVIFIAIFWHYWYRHKADKAYADQSRLLQDYLVSTMTGQTKTDDDAFFPPSTDVDVAVSVDQQQSAEGDETWHGRSPSSSTVSAVRRVVLLAGTNAPA